MPETSSQQIQENESAHELQPLPVWLQSGAIAGGVTMNPIVLGVISGVGLIVKTASEMKNLKSKIEMSKFAFTTYEKTLSDLRFALRGGNFDRTEFLSSMEAIDGIVIDLGLDWEKFENKWKEKFSTE